MQTTNKEFALNRYAEMIEAQCPGKGSAARSIVESGWDQEATNFVDQGRLDSMGYKMDDQIVKNCVKGIGSRHPALHGQLMQALGSQVPAPVLPVREQIAARAAEVLAMPGEKSKDRPRVWVKGSMVRVYLRKGFISVKEDSSIDTSDVGGIAFSQGVAKQLREAGLNVPEQMIAGGIKI